MVFNWNGVRCGLSENSVGRIRHDCPAYRPFVCWSLSWSLVITDVPVGREQVLLLTNEVDDDEGEEEAGQEENGLVAPVPCK